MLYDKVKALCVKNGISIAKLERDAGIANGTIDGWSTGLPNLRTLKAVADVLHVSIDDLIEGIEFGTGGR